MKPLPKFNPSLPFIKEGWHGNPIDDKGRFVNHEHPFTTGFGDVWKWQTGPKPFKQQKKLDTWKPEFIQDTAFLNHTEDCLVWLGHAWFFMRLGGVNMLLDPVFFKIPMVKQIVPNPYPIHLFKNIDYILLSHDHRDHMDERSLRTLGAQNPQMEIITSLGMTPALRKWCKNRITEMGWYQQYSPIPQLTLTYLPTRHWCRRYLSDTNIRLWGAFMIEANGKHIYFGADSGYGSHYQELGQLFPQIDIAMLGIGAFRPEWFMHQAHMSPTHAVQAFNECGAKKFLPMHHATLDLSDEPASEPHNTVLEMSRNGQINGELLLPAVGGTMLI